MNLWSPEPEKCYLLCFFHNSYPIEVGKMKSGKLIELCNPAIFTKIIQMSKGLIIIM